MCQRSGDLLSGRAIYGLKIILQYFVTHLTFHFVMPPLQEDQDNYTVASSSTAEESYHVNTAIGCCTCPAGIHGGHCDHQSAVARMFGPNESFLHGSSPDTRKLYYHIATGEFLFVNNQRERGLTTINHCALSRQQDRTLQMNVVRCWINHLCLRELQELVTRVAILPQVSQRVHSPQYLRSHTVSYISDVASLCYCQ